MPNSQAVRFEVNVPQLCTLKFPTPKLIQGKWGERAMFTLTDGRVLFLDTAVAQSIEVLGIGPGEPFYVAKRLSRDRGPNAYWDVWLAPETERLRAKSEESEIESQLLDTLAQQAEKNGANGHHPPAPDNQHVNVSNLKSIHSLPPSWTDRVREHTQAKLTLYHELCAWAKDNLPGITRNEVRAILMNVMIGAERTR